MMLCGTHSAKKEAPRIMEARLFRTLNDLILQVAHPRRKRVIFCDHWIVLVSLWATLQRRPTCWACQPQNWPAQALDGRELPSGSTMSRRLRTVGVQQLLGRVQTKLADLFPDTLVKQLDTKPLIVGGYSQDRDATRGHVYGKDKARGYKIGALSMGVAIKHWTLAGLNVNDQVLGATLLTGGLTHDRGCFGGRGGYCGADNGFDANRLHALAGSLDHQLVTPPRHSNRGVRDRRRNVPQRLRSLDMTDRPLRACGIHDGFGPAVMRERINLERGFSQLAFDGLWALPPWVRRPHRVAVCVACVIILRLFKLAKKAGLVT